MTEKKIKNNMSSSCLTRRSRNKDLHADWMPDQVGHDRKEEQGRSMVEMLGVLAIVGVLSVGGIAGYRYAMDKHHANEIVHTVSMMAVTASQGLMLNGDFSLGEYGNEISGYAFEYDTNHSKQDDDFSITVKGVDEGVCEQVMNFEWDIPHDIEVNGISGGECDDENDISFVFTDDLGGAWEEMTYGACSQFACKSCHVSEKLKCSRGACICVPEGEVGGCSYYNCITCPADETPMCAPNSSTCICVPKDETGKCSDYACVSCPEDETPICGDFKCFCVPKGEKGACGGTGCITCPADETPMCAPNSSTCICVPEGEVGGCAYYNCITCPADKIPKCPTGSSAAFGAVCTCVSPSAEEGKDWICAGSSCISCAENETLKCPENLSEGKGCLCLSNDAIENENLLCNANACISCPAGETPICSTEGKYGNACICVPEGKTYTCNTNGCVSHSKDETGLCGLSECITCPVGETPKCSDYSGCICVPEGEKGVCGVRECITCPADETPKCGSKGCICVPEGKKGSCGGSGCITCPADETPMCPSYLDGNVCVCVPKGGSGKCNGYACVGCPAGETPKCSSNGRGDDACVCVAKGETDMCAAHNCVSCPKGKTPQCKANDCACFNEGESGVCKGNVCKTCLNGKTVICPSSPSSESDCICIEEGEKYQCNNYSCISCPADKEAFCENKSCVCSNPEDVFKGSDGKNYACSTTSTVTSDESACSACNKTDYPRFYSGGKCYLDCRTSETPLISSTGSCYACDTATSIITDEAACSRCSELRTMENGRCVLKNCPVIDGEVYVKNRTGGCTKCSAAGIPYSDIGHLEVCKAAGYPRFTNAAGTISYLCSRAKLGSSNADVCHLCNYAGSPVPRFVGTDNYCYPCSESTSVATSAKECAVCGGIRSYDATTGKCSKAS